MPTRVIVIGAGWSGLATAKTYLQINPSIELTILDADTTVGGVWSAQRIYPGLMSNTPNGLFEYSDLTMVDESHPALKPIPATQVHQYLYRYAEKHQLLSKIRFQTRVVHAKRRTGRSGWVLTTRAGDQWECDKLIVSTGLHSNPKWPDIPSDGFDGTVIHTKSLGQQHHFLHSEEVRKVAVVGACKSAIEAATLCVGAAKHVDWIIRDGPHGAPLVVVDPAANPHLVALNNTRMFSTWAPSIFSTSGFWYGFLHKGEWRLGSLLYRSFWSMLSSVTRSVAGYEKSENGQKIRPTEQNFFRLVPYLSLVLDKSPFLGWLHDPKKITVYRGTPTKLVQGGIQLDTGETLDADAVIYATGWQSSVDFFDDVEAAQLGVPVTSESQSATTEKTWARLERNADNEVTSLLPALANWPMPNGDTESTQFRMYRQVLSPQLLAEGDHTIAFVSFVSSGQTALCAETLALWAVAHLEDIFPRPLPTQNQMMEEVAKVNAWMARRYGARGRKDPEIISEVQSFIDVLMTDLGLRVERKRRGLFGALREWLIPYVPSDYNGIVSEFLNQIRPKVKDD